MPRERAKERACDKAILRTLAYRSIFKYPLSFYQLSTFLISPRKFDYDFFNKSLRKLAKGGRVKVKDGRHSLPSVKTVSWSQHFKTTEKLIDENRSVFLKLAKIPWIRFVGITGSVAAYNAEKETDIDIFVITQKNRLWLSRIFLVAMLKVMHKYPRSVQNSGTFCPNILVDATCLCWPESKQNLHIAHDIVLMQPIIDRDNMYLRFLNANDWVCQYFPNYYVHALPKDTRGYKQSLVLNLLEKLLYQAQIRYMHKKVTTEKVGKHSIHFNKNDRSPEILREYEERTAYLKGI